MMNKNSRIQIIKICLIFCLFSIISISNVSALQEEDEPTLRSLVTAPPPLLDDEQFTLPQPLVTVPPLLLLDITDAEEESYLYSFIEKYLVRKDNIPESKSKKVLRFSAQSFGVLIGSLAGVPYFLTAQNSANGNEALSWVIAITNTISMSGTGAWSYSKLLKDLDPQSAEERVLLQKNKLPGPLHVASHILGVISSIPNTYIIYLYNTQKWFAGITFFLDYSLQTNGYLELFRKMKAHKSKIKGFFCRKMQSEDLERDPSFHNTRKLLIRHLSHKTIPALLTMPSDERDRLVTLIYHGDNFTVENYLESLLNLTFSTPLKTPDTWKDGYPRAAFISFLSISAIFNLVHNGFCSYKTWQAIYDDSYFVMPMTIVSTLPIFILEIKATIAVGYFLYNYIFYLISREPQPPSLLHVLYPKTSKALPFVCMPLGGVSAYVSRFLVSSILEEIIPQITPRLTLVVGGFLGPFLFSAYTNYSFIQDVLLKYARYFGETTKRNFVRLIQDIEKLIEIVSLTQEEQIEKFKNHPNVQNSISILNNEDSRESLV
ncbi:MAG TPA: hypothetical protein PLY23_06890 [Alphaproteobacteria bacterium]|nr:MAG: hypothetical protein B7X84_08030 [Alphaproteobacteria bacterium 17-39-52]HQS84610.1 hypothetical protein [Alphaproteobacteria bacterium]HQS93663.1 hypothetical protein [Alphaproteobacteria bacterium]